MTTQIKTPAEIGALIRTQRKRLKLDQAGLAKRVGVSRKWINEVEQGKPGAGIGLILKTLNVLDLKLHAGDDDWFTQKGLSAQPKNRLSKDGLADLNKLLSPDPSEDGLAAWDKWLTQDQTEDE